MTQHAPSLQSVTIRYKNDPVTTAYASDMIAFIVKHQPDFWIHNHIHSLCHYHIGRTYL